MSLRSASVTTALALAAGLVGSNASAQVATVRGKVFDLQGQPLAGVHIELKYLGENRQKADKAVETDDKGGYIQAGLLDGPWRITYTKDGYRPYGFETYISLGGLSELPDVQLAEAPVATPTPPPAPVAVDSAAEVEKALKKDYDAALQALSAGKNDEALKLFEKVLETAPDAAPVHFNIGVIHFQAGRLAEAEAAFRKVIELDPKYDRAQLALAALLDSEGRSEEGLEVLLGSAETFADKPTFQLATAIAAINAGRESEARPALERALAVDPDLAEAHYHLATLLMGAGDVEGAVSHLERYLELSPDGQNAEVATALIQALKN